MINIIFIVLRVLSFLFFVIALPILLAGFLKTVWPLFMVGMACGSVACLIDNAMAEQNDKFLKKI